MRRAAIAIGSNSTRLLVADRQGDALVNSYRGREETRLFLGLDAAGNIAPQRLEDTARAVARLAGEARARGAADVALFATSATRDAKNGDALARRIREMCGLQLRVIPGEEEARLAFAAVAGRERRLVMDIGGGSTEFTWGEAGQVHLAVSAQMGASRLLTLCPIKHPRDAERALHLAREALAPFAERLAALPPAPLLVGLGGTCTAAAAIQAGRALSPAETEGRTVTRREARRQLRLLSGLSPEARAQVPGLPPTRAAHMPHGLCIFLAALDVCGMDAAAVSCRTNLDGYLLSLKTDPEKTETPESTDPEKTKERVP